MANEFDERHGFGLHDLRPPKVAKQPDATQWEFVRVLSSGQSSSGAPLAMPVSSVPQFPSPPSSGFERPFSSALSIKVLRPPSRYDVSVPLVPPYRY